MSVLLEQALKLPVDERRQLADDIYESLNGSLDAVYLTPEQEAELDRRIEYNRLHPDEVIPWEDVRERLRQRA
jgi:putative addiction module component (TIGR02574 family)